MKILVHELGEDEFRRQVEEEFAHFLTLGHRLPAGRDTTASRPISRRRRSRPAFARRSTARDPDFALWVDRQVVAAQGARLRDRQHQPEADRRHPRRRSAPSRWTSMADLAERIQLRRAARHACAEHRAAARPQGRSLHACGQTLDDSRAGDGQSRPRHRHHRLPGARLLQPRQRALDPGRAEDRRALRRSGRASATSASSRSRSRAASTPAATTTPATSASSASTGRAARTTSCCSAARARGDVARPRSPAPASTRTASSTRSRSAVERYRAHARSPASASSTPTAASAWMPFKEAIYG